MTRRTTLPPMLVAAAAGIAVTAAPALAKPMDRIDRFGDAHPAPSYQDLRGEHARDAARIAELQEHFLPGQPTWPTHPAPAPKLVAKPPTAAPASDGGNDDVWLIVGLTAAGIIGAGAAGAAHRSRVRARRVAV